LVKAVNQQIHKNLKKKNITIPQGIETPKAIGNAISRNLAAFMDRWKLRKNRIKKVKVKIRNNIQNLAQQLKTD